LEERSSQDKLKRGYEELMSFHKVRAVIDRKGKGEDGLSKMGGLRRVTNKPL